MLRHAMAGFLAGCFSSPIVFAQADAIVVTASRTEQRLADAIPHTTVITQKDIQDSRVPDLPALLRREAGIEVSQNGGVGGLTSVFMRGARSAETLVLVDGVRMEDASAGTTAIQHIMLDQVERVEIVRGNVSSLYGSGAMGGVIQIFTKRGSGQPAVSSEVTMGSRGTSRLTGSYGGEVERTRFNVTASNFDTQGFSSNDPSRVAGANPDRNGYRNESVSGSVSHALSASNELGATLYRTRGRLSFDNAFGVPTDVNRSTQELGTTQVYWEAKPLDAVKSRLSLAEGVDYRTDTLNGAFNNSSNTRNRQIIWSGDWRAAPAHDLSLGIESLRQTLDSSSAGTQARNVGVGRFGYVGRFGAHSLQANARTERYSDFGRANTYFLGYGFDLTDAWKLIASTSTAFRAPTFVDLFFPVFGNPKLKPERSQTQEAGVQWAAGSQRVRIVAFSTRYQDAITFDPVTFVTQNVLAARAQGVESSYTGQLLGFDVRASLTLQKATEQQPGASELPGLRRAKQFGSLSVFRTDGRWRYGAELLGAGAHPDIDPTTFNRISEAGYTLLNLTARYSIDKHFFGAVRLENGLNDHYQLVSGFNSPPRGIFITAGWQP
ncbi:MAG TPA: TonB-dependent receptor [Burkholderiales bacterium]